MNASNKKFVTAESIMWTSRPTGKAAVLYCLFIICVLTGCKSFRPVEDQAHYYVLSSAATAPTTVISNQNLTIGVAPVQTPAYLQNTRIVICRGTNEIRYSEYCEWAEHLDKGIQRVVASDISSLLPSARVITSAWQSSDVKAEVDLSIQRFELDEHGEVILDCEWRIITTGAPGTSRFNHSVIHKKGPQLASDPRGAVSTLSEALADLSKEIAAAVRTL
jgi:uncharacterized lipoprotein YmbA